MDKIRSGRSFNKIVGLYRQFKVSLIFLEHSYSIGVIAELLPRLILGQAVFFHLFLPNLNGRYNGEP
jgi:hypothetical protein